MKHFLAILSTLSLFAAPASAQTLRSLMISANDTLVQTQRITFPRIGLSGGTAANPPLTYTSGTNTFGTFASSAAGIGPHLSFSVDGTRRFFISTNTIRAELPISFGTASNASETRLALGFNTNLNTLWSATNAESARNAIGAGTGGTNSSTRVSLGFSTNLDSLWTATNAANFRDAVGLGALNSVTFDYVSAAGAFYSQQVIANSFRVISGGNILFDDAAGAANTRANLGLGATNQVTFGQTTVSNGTLFVYKTNAGAFEGLANMLAANNTTVGNETLFRVGRAETTNQSAQFGFRVTRTNNGGEGLAVFSVWGYNALMMIGPSDRSRTGSAVEADIWTTSPSNRVMTLRDTNTGALTLHQDLGFAAALTNSAPTNTNTPAAWMRVWVGTNNYRMPLYQ
jgi:hypothetical protein